MEITTALIVGFALAIALFIPYAIFYMRRGKAHGHTWFTWWKPRGHSDIGPEIGPDGFRQTRPGADDARGARY